LQAACTIRSRTAGTGNGLCPVVPGFGMNTPPGRQQTIPAFPQLAGQLTEQPGDPVLLGLRQGDLSMPDVPLLARTATHARHSTSLRQTLSYSAWNLRPGSALAAR
jgi:hypothetical protein